MQVSLLLHGESTRGGGTQQLQLTREALVFETLQAEHCYPVKVVIVVFTLAPLEEFTLEQLHCNLHVLLTVSVMFTQAHEAFEQLAVVELEFVLFVEPDD